MYVKSVKTEKLPLIVFLVCWMIILSLFTYEIYKIGEDNIKGWHQFLQVPLDDFTK